MNEELDKKLCTDFPLLYRDRRANMKHTCMCWGFPGTGWHDLIRDLSSKLEPLIAKERETSQYCFCGCKKDEHENGTGKCSHVDVLPFMIHRNYTTGYNPNDFNTKHWRFYYRWVIKDWILNKTNRFLRFLSKFGVNYKKHCDCTGFDPSHPVAVQVKEKFGQLRFYLSSESDEMSEYIREAEDRSAITCEECGEPGITRTDLSWHLTLCDKHYTPPKEENYDHIVPTVL